MIELQYKQTNKYNSKLQYTTKKPAWQSSAITRVT